MNAGVSFSLPTGQYHAENMAVSGSHFGPDQILSGLGAGAMGQVYRARDPRLGRDVAIKILPAAALDGP